MKLKCIGGLKDGEWHETGMYDKLGDTVKIPLKQEMPAIYDYLNTNNIPNLIKEQYIYYAIDCFHFSKDDRYLFLRPADWTNKKAVEYQFGK